jgi:hypothetical protein
LIEWPTVSLPAASSQPTVDGQSTRPTPQSATALLTSRTLLVSPLAPAGTACTSRETAKIPFPVPKTKTTEPTSALPQSAALRAYNPPRPSNTLRASSPLPGATGPSHPYAMYPQDTNLARNSSTSTTASTIRVAQPLLAASQGPTHPYSMYPQDVSGHDDEEHHDATTASSSRVQTVIPVGFPGRTQVFVRARGTEDEEQDIIGVDGHSEQLPPYSEYPEDGVPKPIALPGQLATPPNGTQVHIPLIQQQQQRRPESMSDQADAEMQQLTSTDPDGSSSEKKSWNEKSWKEKRKTRVCGIPFWWILLSLCVLAFISIVLGAAIGGIFASARKEAEKATV